jgi:hypothetical protein
MVENQEKNMGLLLEIGVEKGREIEKVVVGPKNEKVMVCPILKTRKKIRGKVVLQRQSVKGGVGSWEIGL